MVLKFSAYPTKYMALVTDEKQTGTAADGLALEAKNRLREFTTATFITYGNLMNYQGNNAQGVTKEQFTKALGKDAKDFNYVLGGMKRLLLRLNPALKDQLKEMVPKRTRK